MPRTRCRAALRCFPHLLRRRRCCCSAHRGCWPRQVPAGRRRCCCCCRCRCRRRPPCCCRRGRWGPAEEGRRVAAGPAPLLRLLPPGRWPPYLPAVAAPGNATVRSIMAAHIVGLAALSMLLLLATQRS